MALITDKTQIKLISKLSGTSTFNGSDLLLLQRGFKSYKFNYSDLVSALPDGSTLEASSNQLGVKDSGVDTPQLANNSVNFSKMQDIDASSTKKVIGKMSGNGDPTEVDVITNLGTASNNNIPTGLAVTNYVDNEIDNIDVGVFAYALFAGNVSTIFVDTGFSSIVRNSAGVYTLEFSIPRDSPNDYVVIATREFYNPLEGDIVVRNRTQNGFVLHSSNDNASAGDPSAVHVTVIG